MTHLSGAWVSGISFELLQREVESARDESECWEQVTSHTSMWVCIGGIFVRCLLDEDLVRWNDLSTISHYASLVGEVLAINGNLCGRYLYERIWLEISLS